MRLLTACLVILYSTVAGGAGNAVLVTAVEGGVQLEGLPAGKDVVEAFTRLNANDRLIMSAHSKTSLVYVQSGRLEHWRGAGSLQVGDGESKTLNGKPEVQVRRLPLDVTRLMNRTPGPQDGRVGMMRLAESKSRELESRAETSISRQRGNASRMAEMQEESSPKKSSQGSHEPSPRISLDPSPVVADQLIHLDTTYKALRADSLADDLTPEIFLLAGLFDLRQYERMDREFRRIASAFPKDVRVEVLRENYRKAIVAVTQPEALQ